MPPKSKRQQTASLRHEHEFYAQGCRFIFGMDEVGRGSLAGPVTVGAVCLPVTQPDIRTVLKGVRDSKEMTSRQRVKLVDEIKAAALAHGVGSATNQEIDDVGIVPATKLAMKRAIAAAIAASKIEPDCLFLDSLLWPEMKQIPQVSMIDGDHRSLSIAAASVVAKVWRDALMIELDPQYPDYGFALHKGYGTPAHLAAIKSFGASDLHRQTFAPMRTHDDNE